MLSFISELIVVSENAVRFRLKMENYAMSWTELCNYGCQHDLLSNTSQERQPSVKFKFIATTLP